MMMRLFLLRSSWTCRIWTGPKGRVALIPA